MDEINERNFVDYLDQLPEKNECLHHHADYHFWGGVDLKIETQFFRVGKINLKSNAIYDRDHNNKEVDLNTWPYYFSNIYCCKRCKALFFHCDKDIDSRYDSFRMIRKEILNENTFKISTDKYEGNLNKTFFSKVWNKLFKI